MSYTPYDSHNHASPLLEGKKNSAFLNPNLRSSNVFYDYDYSYKNDMHNPRLLSAVKNDKFSSTTPRNDRYETRSTYETTPSEQGDRPVSAFSSPKKAWDTESVNSDRDQDYYKAPLDRSQRGSVPNLRSGNQTRTKDLDTLSTISEEPNAMNFRATKNGRAPGKYCLDCVNSSLADKQRCKKDSHKTNDHQHMKEWTAQEAKKAALNSQDKTRQENTIARKHQVEAKAHAAYHDYTRVYGKERPEVEGGVVIDAIFDKQEERAKQNKMNERNLRSYNFDKMVDTQGNKDSQRLDRLTSEHNSLQVGEKHVNKYLPPSGTVVKDLQQQIESNADRNARLKEAEQRRDQELLEANRIAMDRERQAKAEKTESYKRMLSDQLAARTQVKEAEKEKQRVENQKAKYYADKGAEDHSAKLQDKEMNKKRNKEMFMNSLKEHQQESSYRKKFEDKKTKLEGNGVTLKLGAKPEMDNCAGCNKLKDANHLTHYNH